MAIQGHVFWSQWKGNKGLNEYITLASFPKVRKDLKIDVFNHALSFDAPSPRNPREYPHKIYIASNYSHCATSSPLTVWVYLHSNFPGGLPKRMHFKTERDMALQGH